ncbi:hypothetical protein ACLOJK_015282, partial [Asimina triloba]
RLLTGTVAGGATVAGCGHGTQPPHHGLPNHKEKILPALINFYQKFGNASPINRRGQRAMSAVLAFEFMPGGGFTLSNGRSFDLAIPHQFIHVLASMARQTYSYVDYSPTAITLAADGNWPTLLAVATSLAPQPSHKAATTVVASLAPRPSRKAATAAATSSAPRPSRKAAA